MEKLSNAEVRKFKSEAQRMKPMLKVGRAGVTPEFLVSLEQMFAHHELIKLKFDEHKEERKTLAPLIAEKSSSHLITILGNVFVLYKPKAVAA